MTNIKDDENEIDYWKAAIPTFADKAAETPDSYVPIIGSESSGILMAEAVPLLIAAGTARGKSFIQAQLIRSLFTGLPWLDRFEVEQIPQWQSGVWLTLDRGSLTFRRFRSMITEMELPLIKTRLRIVSYSTLGDARLETEPRTLLNMAKAHAAKWLIVDGLDKLVKDAATTDSGMALEAGITYAVEGGINVVATTHLKKDQREKSYDGKALGDIYGTSKIANVFGSIITLPSPEGGARVVEFMQLKNVMGDPVVGSLRHDHHDGKSFFMQGDLFGAIRDLGGSATVTELDAAMNKHSNTIRKELKEQEALGMVTRAMGGGGSGSGSNSDLWSLTEEAIHTHFPTDSNSTSQEPSQAFPEVVTPQLNGTVRNSQAIHSREI